MNEERAKIEAERAESQKMMEELMALKAQLAEKQDSEASTETQKTDEENI